MDHASVSHEKYRLAYTLFVRYYGLAFLYVATLLGGPLLFGALLWDPLPLIFYGALCFPSACVLAYSMLPRFPRYRPWGIRLDPGRHPAVHAKLREIGAACGIEAPLEVFVDLRLNASAGLAPVDGRQAVVVTVGLPLFTLLSRPQLCAILAHEVGHVHHRDFPFARVTARMMASIERSIALLLRARSPLFEPFVRYHQQCLRRLRPFARRQELMADAFAVQFADRDAFARALQRIEAFSHVHQRFMESALTLARDSGLLPPLVRGFPTDHPAVVQAAADHLRHLPQAAAERATHPALRERLAALGVAPPDAFGTDPGEPGTVLLEDDLGALERDLASALVGRELQPSDAAEVLLRHLEPSWRRYLGRYQRILEGITAAEIDALTTSYAFVYALVEVERERDVTEEHARDVLDQLVGCLLCFVLRDRGWAVDYVPGVVLALRRDGEAVEPFGVLEQLRFERLAPDVWKARARTWGIADVDLGRYVPPADDRAGEAGSSAAG